MSLRQAPLSASAATAPLTTPIPRKVLILGAALVLAVVLGDLPLYDAPWLHGDDQTYIVDNPAVTGAGLTPDTWSRRLALIFEFPPEGDLYQPLPILTYALQWMLVGNAPLVFRLTDMALHAANALLLWAVLYILLGRSRETAERGLRLAVTWVLALLWALHPMLVAAWAADMARTHVLATTFALLALLLHLRSIEQRRPALFLAAMLCLVACSRKSSWAGLFSRWRWKPG
jgi:hypothetical protein